MSSLGDPMGRGTVTAIVGVSVMAVLGMGAWLALAGGDGGGTGPADPPAPVDEPDDTADDAPPDGADEPADVPEPEEATPDEPEPTVETVTDDVDGPWGLAFVPGEERLLVTQVTGTLSAVDPGTGEVVDLGGVPEVDTAGQGGLLDVTVHPAFPDPDWLYLTYAAADDAGATSTHLSRARLDLDEQRLEDLEVLYAAEPFLGETVHYGSRVEVGPEGHLFLTIGDRGDKDFDDHVAQDTSNPLGATLRLESDGSVPDDNPHVDDDSVLDEIYTYGHRNVQGMAVHPTTGEVWQSEHGEEDGDEINVLEAGGDHGWPRAHTGCEYGTQTPVGEHPEELDDVVDPVFFWECTTGGFPPAGMTFYEGDELPAWEGDLLVGGLASEHLARFTEDDGELEEVEPLLEGQGWRIRDVVVGPHDGAVYVAADGDDAALVRLVDGAAGS